jgi:alpha-mannosidase
LSEIRGEAQVISPHETWPAITPWTQGFAVAPGAEQSVSFSVAPPFDSSGGRYWALVKLMYFGRIIYSEAIEIVISSPAVLAAATRSERGAVRVATAATTSAARR